MATTQWVRREYTTSLKFEHDNPLLLYEKGSPCAADMEVRTSTAIRFLCDKTVFGTGSPQLVASLPPDSGTPCAFFFEWRTHVACPGAPRTSLGSAVGLLLGMIILFLFIMIALLIAYRWIAMRKRGLELLPKPSFDSVTDFVQRIFRRPARDRWEGQPRSGDGRLYYESLGDENEPLNDNDGTRLSYEDAGDRPVDGPDEVNHNNW